MRNLRLISATAAILLLGVGALSAQNMKTDETPAPAPGVQQNAPAEKVAPTLNSDQRKTPETMGQTAPAAPEADKKQLKSQTIDTAPTGAAVKRSSDANGSAIVTDKKSAAESGAGAASRSGKSAEDDKRSTTGQGTVSEGAVGGPKLVRHRHYSHHRHHRHYRDCWPNIFDHGNCW